MESAGEQRTVSAAAFWMVALGIVAFLAGWQSGWIELFVFAAGVGIVLALSASFLIGRGSVTLARDYGDEKREAGSAGNETITVTNQGRVPNRPQVVTELIDGRPLYESVASLSPGKSEKISFPLPTRRGRYQLGPARVTRGDPLGLFSRSLGSTRTEELWVRPRVLPTRPLGAGFAKDLEGPTFDTSPAGDIAFHTVREYQHGDDPRHVHWMSTARTGQLMVRHYVDNRRPHLAVAIDRSSAAMTREQFDVAIDIAASLGASGLREQHPIGIYVGAEAVVGVNRSASKERLLDRLTEVTQLDEDNLAATCINALRRERGSSVLVVVTGARPATELVRTVRHAARRVRVIVVRVCEGAEADIALPRGRVLNVIDLRQFVGRWARLAA